MIREIGGFDESLFIDCVDTDYVARARACNWLAIPISDAVIDHKIGDSIPLKIGKRQLKRNGRLLTLSYHAPFRTYYTMRNQLRLLGRYSCRGNVLSPMTFLVQALILVALTLVAPDRRLQRKAVVLGLKDAFLRRSGRIGAQASQILGLTGASSAQIDDHMCGSTPQMRMEILLSTWNGEKYIAALLHSILNQDTAASVSILVRDDGSSDGTLSILREFQELHSNIRVLEGNNRGVDDSFHELMVAASDSADLYFYCDQDDVWMPDKVESAAMALKEYINATKPVLYCSRSMVTNSSLKEIGPTSDYDSPGFSKALVMNIAPGHTMALNRELLQLVRSHFDADRIMIFDHWTYLVAAGLGSVIFDHDWHTLYRNHDNNAIGYSPRETWVTRWKKLKQNKFGEFTKQAAFFEQEFGERLNPVAAARVRGFVHQGSWLDRAKYLRRFGIDHGPLLASITGALVFLGGGYRP